MATPNLPLPPPPARQPAAAPQQEAPVWTAPGGAATPEPLIARATAPVIQSVVNPVAMLEAKIEELERWMGDMLAIVQRVHPPLKALLVPMANIGKAFQAEIARIKEQSQQIPIAGGKESLAPEQTGEPPAT